MADPNTPDNDEFDTPTNAEHDDTGQPAGTHEHDEASEDELDEDVTEQDDDEDADSTEA